MGQVSQKLRKRFSRWSGRFRQQIGQTSLQASTPIGVHDIKKLVKDGYDPLHAVYVWVQNIASVFAECVSVLPELKAYAERSKL